MEEIWNVLIQNVDLIYILVCNFATYTVIKFLEMIDTEDDKIKIKTWVKRLISTFVAILLGLVFFYGFHHDLQQLFVGFFLQFLTYDYLLKGFIKWAQNKTGAAGDE